MTRNCLAGIYWQQYTYHAQTQIADRKPKLYFPKIYLRLTPVKEAQKILQLYPHFKISNNNSII
jgi:hypothetical protein